MKLKTYGVVVPPYADEVVQVQKENLRVLREYVMLVVRDYNMTIESMDDTEKKLFKQHLEVTERVIHPGLVKLKWSSKGILEGFVRDCRRSCAELFNKLNIFKRNT
jgi:dynein heavy chain